MRTVPAMDEYRISTISVDSYENAEPRGRLANPFYEEAQSFESLTQLLKQVEAVLELTNRPQSFTDRRSFALSTEPLGNSPPAGPAGRGRLASFSLCIRFRQNSSWQGSLHWLEKGLKQNFRSVLELIFLMDSALQRADAAEESTA